MRNVKILIRNFLKRCTYIILEIIHFNFCFRVAMNICERVERKVFFFFKYIIITFVINQYGINQFSVLEIRPF